MKVLRTRGGLPRVFLFTHDDTSCGLKLRQFVSGRPALPSAFSSSNNDEFGQTILFSSHITTDIERVAADVAILHEGKIKYHGGLDELKESGKCLFLRVQTDADVINSISGVISKRVDGDRLQIWVRDWDDDKNEELNEKLGASDARINGHQSVSVVPEYVALEELFMGMTS